MKILERPFLTVLYDKCVLSINLSKKNMHEIMHKIDDLGVIDKDAEYDVKIEKKTPQALIGCQRLCVGADK